jgi:hypothetical protein
MFRGSAGVPPALAGILPASKTATDSKTADSQFFAVSVADTPAPPRETVFLLVTH